MRIKIGIVLDGLFVIFTLMPPVCCVWMTAGAEVYDPTARWPID